MYNKYINVTIKTAFFTCLFVLVSCAGDNKSNVKKDRVIKEVNKKIKTHPDYINCKNLPKEFQSRVEEFFRESSKISSIEKNLTQEKEFSDKLFRSDIIHQNKDYYKDYFNNKYGVSDKIIDDENKIFKTILKDIKKDYEEIDPMIDLLVNGYIRELFNSGNHKHIPTKIINLFKKYYCTFYYKLILNELGSIKELKDFKECKLFFNKLNLLFEFKRLESVTFLLYKINLRFERRGTLPVHPSICTDRNTFKIVGIECIGDSFVEFLQADPTILDKISRNQLKYDQITSYSIDMTNWVITGDDE